MAMGRLSIGRFVAVANRISWYSIVDCSYFSQKQNIIQRWFDRSGQKLTCTMNRQALSQAERQQLPEYWLAMNSFVSDIQFGRLDLRPWNLIKFYFILQIIR